METTMKEEGKNKKREEEKQVRKIQKKVEERERKMKKRKEKKQGLAWKGTIKELGGMEKLNIANILVGNRQKKEISY